VKPRVENKLGPLMWSSFISNFSFRGRNCKFNQNEENDNNFSLMLCGKNIPGKVLSK